MECLKPFFTTMATGFHTAKRKFHAATGAVVIDENLTASDAPGHAKLTCPLSRPDASHQTKGCRVRQLHGMVFVAKRHGDEDWAKHFFLGQAVHGWYVAQQGGGLVEAGLWCFIDDFALGHHLNIGDLGVAQKIPDTLLLALANQWPQIQVQRSRANAQLFKFMSQTLQQGLVDDVINQQTRTR